MDFIIRPNHDKGSWRPKGMPKGGDRRTAVHAPVPVRPYPLRLSGQDVQAISTRCKKKKVRVKFRGKNAGSAA